MALAAFDPTITIVNTLSGGVNSIHRVLVLARGSAQATAASSLTNQFASRIDAALALLDRSATTPLSEALLRQQSQLISRKERINDSIGVLNQAFTQIGFLKNHVQYLEDQITALEAGDITAAALAIDFDNKLRKINQLSAAAAESFKDGGVYFQKNLIASLSRSSFATQTLFAPYNSRGDTLQIDGVYLGTDYYITDSDDLSIDIDNVTDTGSGFTVTARSIDDQGQLTDASADNIALHNSSPQGFGVSGGATLELGYDSGADFSEQLIVSLDSDVSSADVSFAWKHSGDDATYEFYKDGVKVGEGTSIGGSDGIDPAVTLSPEDGSAFDQIVFMATDPGDNYLINSIDFEAFQDGDFWNSDTGFAASEDTVGTLIEYSSYPDTATGITDAVTDLTLNSINTSTGDIDFDLSAGNGSANITGTLTKGGLGILDAWLYEDFANQAAIDRAKDDLDAAESLILLTEADFLADRATLQSRATVFDTLIGGLAKEIADIAEDIESDREAELLAAQLEFQVARFQFALLAARGNTLVFSLILSQDSGLQPNTRASSEAVLGATLNVNV
jgi:hypothetical protein